VILGTIGIPTILLIIMFALPFVDVRRERRLLRRPVAIVASIIVVISMGTLTYKGAVAKESLGTENLALVPEWAKTEGFATNQKAIAGAKVFAQVGCMTCHTYSGAGASNLGAPDLTAEGANGKGADFQVRHLKCPSCENSGSPMPSFTDLGDENLNNLAAFLEASKGAK
jgi:mono/diheme cytochrome c family protein